MWSCKVAFQQRSINHSAAAPKSFIGELWLKNKGISYQEKGCTSIVSRVIPVHFFPIWSKAILDFGCWCHSELDHSKCFNGTASLPRAFYGGLGKWKKNISTEKKPLDRWRAAKDLQGRGKHWIIDVPPRLSCPSGRIPLPNRVNFWKNSKRPLTPPSFLENYIAIFYNGYGRICARRHRPDGIS